MKSNDVKIDEIINALRFGTKKAVSGAENMAKNVVKKTSGFVDRAKTSYMISEIEEKIDVLVKEIGMFIYDKSKDGLEMPEEIDDRCEKIDLLYDELKTLKEKLAEERNEKVCSSCGEANNINAQFCQKCGERFDTSKASEADETDEMEEEDTITLNPKRKTQE